MNNLKRNIIIAFFLLSLIWVIMGIIHFVDFEAWLDGPEELVLHFQEALVDFDFERAWSKLSPTLQDETFQTQQRFTDYMYFQYVIRDDIANAQIQTIDYEDENSAEILLKNWFLKDYVIINVKRKDGGPWKIEKFRTNLSL